MLSLVCYEAQLVAKYYTFASLHAIQNVYLTYSILIKYKYKYKCTLLR